MPHEKEKKTERGMQFRVALRMLILPVPNHRAVVEAKFQGTLSISCGNASGISFPRGISLARYHRAKRDCR